jgi:hypothetical protein
LVPFVKPFYWTGALGRRDGYGQRYTLDFVLEWQDRSATISTGWIMEHNSDKQVGINKYHTQKSGFLKKPDFSTPASFRFNYAYLLIAKLTTCYPL